MSKRPSLAEKMRQAVTPDAPPVNVPQAPIVSQPQPPHERPARAVGFYAATRAGKKKVTATLDPPAHKRLKQLGLDQDRTTEALLVEAISDLFTKYGLPPIA